MRRCYMENALSHVKHVGFRLLPWKRISKKMHLNSISGLRDVGGCFRCAYEVYARALMSHRWPRRFCPANLYFDTYRIMSS